MKKKLCCLTNPKYKLVIGINTSVNDPRSPWVCADCVNNIPEWTQRGHQFWEWYE